MGGADYDAAAPPVDMVVADGAAAVAVAATDEAAVLPASFEFWPQVADQVAGGSCR